jgi:hypothetical protein
MPLIFLLSFSLFAAEVVTLSKSRTGPEVQFMATDESVVQAVEKTFLTHSCKVRTNLTATTLKEYFVPSSCRAELMKIILNSGYKPLDARTFTKQP